MERRGGCKRIVGELSPFFLSLSLFVSKTEWVRGMQCIVTVRVIINVIQHTEFFFSLSNPHLLYSFSFFHSGMLPCFFQGLDNFLDRSKLRSVQMSRRVETGSMMSSTNPRFAAENGLVNLSMYSCSSRSASLDPRYKIDTAPLAPMTAISAVGHA